MTKYKAIRLNPSIVLSMTGIDEASKILTELDETDNERSLIVSRENRKLAGYLVSDRETFSVVSIIAEEDFWALQNSKDTVIGFESW